MSLHVSNAKVLKLCDFDESFYVFFFVFFMEKL